MGYTLHSFRGWHDGSLEKFAGLLLILAPMMIANLFAPPNVLAKSQETTVFGLGQHDLDGDGAPDLTIIHCGIAANNDLVYVYDGAGDMQTAAKWDKATDFTNDTWIFDLGGDNSAQLIIKFSEENTHTKAYLYLDQDGDNEVAYRLINNKLSIEELGSWAIKVEADGYWLLPDGSPNQNLRFTNHDHPESYKEIVDKNHDGIPEYEVWNLSKVSSDGNNLPGSGMWINFESTRPQSWDNSIFWPFLIDSKQTAEGLKGKIKFSTMPFVAIDWEHASLKGISIGKDVSGFPIEAGSFYSSFTHWREYDLNRANFENPMAYYDLAEDHDNFPELMIRSEYFEPLDKNFDVGLFNKPYNDIRYSWNQDNSSDLVWDYKVGLVGTNLITGTVSVGDFSIASVPYFELPYWVSGRTWEWGTLIANEGGGYPSGEGIYEWSASNVFQADASDPTTIIPSSQLDLRNYLTGRSELSPDRFYQQIRKGLRGEFGYLQDKPYLYFSPVDAKLHLLKAHHGIWNIGENAEIRYANLDQDAYVDQWQYFVDDRLISQLNFSQDYLLLSEPTSDTAFLRQNHILPSLFETLPPRNYTEWLALGNKLKQNKHELAPGDFEAMLEQLGGIQLHITCARVSDYRPTETGFRFVLELQPGFTLAGPDWLGLNGMSPGEYLVSYNGVFQAQPLTPPDLKLSVNPESTQELPTAYLAGEVRAVLQNAGLQDAQQVLVELGAAQPGREMVWTEPQTVTVLAGETTRLSFPWTPPAPEDWNLRVRVRLLDPEAAKGVEIITEQSIAVQPAQTTNLRQVLSAFRLAPPWAVLLAAGSAVLTAGLFTWVIFRSKTNG
jgi:hypothetical protein